MRGALQLGVNLRHVAGIIPACAGSTHMDNDLNNMGRDHPRMCGEHSFDTVGVTGAVGSSPHVRGAQGRQQHGDSRRGIIPACAGSTGTDVGTPSNKRDHPRMCGEHVPPIRVGGAPSGSSPHVRGALRPRKIRLHIRGIIPACAGSTLRRWTGSVPSRDHPRMCGEHRILAI